MSGWFIITSIKSVYQRMMLEAEFILLMYIHIKIKVKDTTRNNLYNDQVKMYTPEVLIGFNYSLKQSYVFRNELDIKQIFT